MVLDISIWAAFLAGLLSFLSPCVLPLVPPYLCFITGRTLEELTEPGEAEGGRSRAVVLAAACFVLGFATVFVSLGVSASAVGQVLRQHLDLFGKIAGAAIILMGLHFLGVFRLTVLDRDTRFQRRTRPSGLVGAYGMGLAFAFGWTPCIGPVLATILAVAASKESIGQGGFLLSIYSAGLGVPFVLAALGVGNFVAFLKRFRGQLRRVEQTMGALLVLTGVMFLTGAIQTTSYWLLEMFPGLAALG
jgi:cytochrome c-type biogenesis protein